MTNSVVTEIDKIIEEITGKPDPADATTVLVGWFSTILNNIASSSNPAETAAAHAATIHANAGNLAQAVASTPVIPMPPPNPGTTQSGQQTAAEVE